MMAMLQHDAGRIITVSPAFYAELAQSLGPDERWFDETNSGFVLYAINAYTGVRRALVFVRECPEVSDAT